MLRKSTALSVINGLTIVGGAWLLVLSLWPGFVVGFCLLTLAYPLIALLGLAWLVAAIRYGRGKGASGGRTSRGLIVTAPVVVVVTYLLLTFYVPRRIAFAVCRGSFQRMIPSAVTREEHYTRRAAGPTAPTWLGIYRVDAYFKGPGSSVYFRTGTEGDGLGPDTVSYGFAYRPDPFTSPFGRKYYRPAHLFGDWYWFQASNDYF